MSGIKRKDTPEARAFWKFVEETAQRVRNEAPGWHRAVDRRRLSRVVADIDAALAPEQEAQHGE